MGGCARRGSEALVVDSSAQAEEEEEEEEVSHLHFSLLSGFVCLCFAPCVCRGSAPSETKSRSGLSRCSLRCRLGQSSRTSQLHLLRHKNPACRFQTLWFIDREKTQCLLKYCSCSLNLVFSPSVPISSFCVFENKSIPFFIQSFGEV